MRVVVTGGTGYIGSHTVLALQADGHEVVIVDNFSNSTPDVLDRITAISGVRPVCVEGDIGDRQLLDRIFATYSFDAVVHFAAWKAVGDSCQDPFGYRENNIIGTMRLLKTMNDYGVRRMLFSSSATVYDSFYEQAPFTEDMRTGHTTNPYGTTKHVIEQLLQDMTQRKDMQITALRYFNPIGAHPSGGLGEDPQDTPTNLLPVIMEVVEGKRDSLDIFGDDWLTPDGTCVRDYIHVVDLANAHILALKGLSKTSTWSVYNVGTGSGISVAQMVERAEQITAMKVPHRITTRRDGDVAVSIADPTLLKTTYNRQPRYTVDDAIAHAWQYRQ